MTLRVYDLALEMISELRPLIMRLERYDRQLAKQLRASASSVALNIGEGSHSRGGHKTERYATASGSNSEVRATLQVAAAWGYITEEQRQPLEHRLDHIAAMLWKLTHRS